MIIKVCALQYPLGGVVSLEDKLFPLRRRPDFVCLPEYFFVNPDCSSFAEAAEHSTEYVAQIAELSRELHTTIVGGSIVLPRGGGLRNTSIVYSHGEFVGEYDKVNLYGHEPERGIGPGTDYRVFVIGGVRIGILICADALNLQSFKELGRLGAEVIFVPTTSPFRPQDTVFDKQARDARIFVRGAQLANAYVVKSGGVGSLFGHPLQGRSGIFAPWGILARTMLEDESKKRVLTMSLEIQEIREFKGKMDFKKEVPQDLLL